jgi:hypothetical protein
VEATENDLLLSVESWSKGISSHTINYYHPNKKLSKVNRKPTGPHPHILLFEIGKNIFKKSNLFKTDGYYRKLANFVYCVARLGRNLLYSDAFSFTNDEWMENTLLLFIIELIIKSKKQFQLVSDEISNKIFFSDEGNWAYFIDTLCFSKKYILLPICAKNHWSLVILDTKSAKFMFFDSLYKVSNVLLQLRFRKLLTFLDYYNSKHVFAKLQNSEKWTVQKFDYDTQEDNFSCGVFVINYVFQFVKDLSVKKVENFNCLTFKQNLKTFILKNSDDMTSLCLKCADLTTLSEGAHFCGNCKRLIHKNCADEEISEKGIYFCPLCKF